jgi:hypothetical protein
MRQPSCRYGRMIRFVAPSSHCYATEVRIKPALPCRYPLKYSRRRYGASNGTRVRRLAIHRCVVRANRCPGRCGGRVGKRQPTSTHCRGIEHLLRIDKPKVRQSSLPGRCHRSRRLLPILVNSHFRLRYPNLGSEEVRGLYHDVNEPAEPSIGSPPRALKRQPPLLLPVPNSPPAET